ncbi:ribosomal protein L7/L12 C-terminal domain-containing protein [Dioszegia hungarica]|uniref:Ribosomal protein L7/L12 C-terminal domain-containing protein n=1 Tax=Dioszegia hungarica TaxID=4972 RepID=A0AA38HBA9_9TREE|nr:ribosomal protein L7/L12 C-terminal domain-containing protein [Dioszegia hungarica]KAI9636785.1 ribosomal protein L7/L12 C-terminal domain-containing protein [Dioszegia hungarica]
MSRPVQSLLRASRSFSPRASSSTPTLRYAARTFTSTRPSLAETAEQPTQSPVSAKVGPIVESISGLTLLEVSELVTALKTRLNITEIAMPSSSAAPAAAAPVEAEAAEEKPKEKTIFTVKLDAIDPATKAKVIREVKVLMPNMTLVEAKKFVESCPQTLKENLPKEDAEKLQKTMQALGATVSLV